MCGIILARNHPVSIPHPPQTNNRCRSTFPNFPPAASLLMLGAAGTAVVAILTENWSSANDGTGAHIGLWKLCWPKTSGAELSCESLEWWPFVQSLRSAMGPTYPYNEAEGKWPVLQASRYGAIGAAAGSFVASVLAGMAVATRHLMPKRVIYGLAATIAILCVCAIAVSCICW